MRPDVSDGQMEQNTNSLEFFFEQNQDARDMKVMYVNSVGI